MKKHRLLSTLAILLTACMLMTGCGNILKTVTSIGKGRDQAAATASSTSENANTNQADGNDQSTDANQSDSSSEDPNITDTSSEDTANTQNDTSKANPDLEKEYLAFLNGEREDTVSFEEFTNDLCNMVKEDWDMETAEPKGICYSFMDCGNDGVEELAVLYEQIGLENLDRNYIAVFKLVDNDIKNVFCEVFGYRSYATMNQYGYYNYGGSNGATSHSDLYSYVNALGETTFLYGLNYEVSAYSLYIPGTTEYMDVAEEEGIAENIEILQYYFENYEDGQDYQEYVKSCDYVIIPLDENYNYLEGDALQEALDSGSYDRFWESTGLNPAFTQEEIDQKINKKLESAGVTDEIKNGAPITWTSWK